MDLNTGEFIELKNQFPGAVDVIGEYASRQGVQSTANMYKQAKRNHGNRDEQIQLMSDIGEEQTSIASASVACPNTEGLFPLLNDNNKYTTSHRVIFEPNLPVPTAEEGIVPYVEYESYSKRQ